MEGNKMITFGDFLKKVIAPITLIGFLLLLFKPLYMVEGEVEVLYLWILVGIPFGMRRMCLWLIPRNYDIGGGMAIIALNFIIGGLIGGFVAIFQILQALWYCLRALRQIVGKLLGGKKEHY